MLKIGSLIDMRVPFTLAGEEHEVLLQVRPPDRAFLQDFGEAADAKAREAFFAPERLLAQLVSWEGLADADGAPLPLTVEALGAVRTAAPTVYAALVDALFASLPKKREADRGN